MLRSGLGQRKFGTGRLAAPVATAAAGQLAPGGRPAADGTRLDGQTGHQLSASAQSGAGRNVGSLLDVQPVIVEPIQVSVAEIGICVTSSQSRSG